MPDILTGFSVNEIFLQYYLTSLKAFLHIMGSLVSCVHYVLHSTYVTGEFFLSAVPLITEFGQAAPEYRQWLGLDKKPEPLQ